MSIPRLVAAGVVLGCGFGYGLAAAPRPAFGQSQGKVPATTPAPAAVDPAKPAKDAAVGPVAALKPYIDLTHRYRFTERYTNQEENAGPDVIGQYRVEMREVLRDAIEDGTSKPVEVVRETAYTERPAEVSSFGVGATIRNYSKFQVRPDDIAKEAGQKALDGLTIWYRAQNNEPPLIISMLQDRRLREREYEVASHQIFVPSLRGLLPTQSIRVGDSWRIPHKAAQGLFGEPDLKGDALQGHFLELRRDLDGKTTHAVLNISGQVLNPFADTRVNAQVVFSFPTPGTTPVAAGGLPAPPPRPASGRIGDEPVVEARGALTELRMTRLSTGVIPGGQEKKYRASQEIVLDRKLGVPSGSSLLKLFDAPPATDVNSWLTFLDPKQRFTFHHPQSLLPPERYQFGLEAGGATVILLKRHNDGLEYVRLDVSEKVQPPEALKEMLKQQWGKVGGDVLAGADEWLPAGEWPNNMKVYHVEAAVKLPNASGRAPRLHYDAYLVQLAEGPSFMVVATSSREGVSVFRRDVERMIKSFRLGV